MHQIYFWPTSIFYEGYVLTLSVGKKKHIFREKRYVNYFQVAF